MARRKRTSAAGRCGPKAASETRRRIEVSAAESGASMRELLPAHHLISEITAALRMSFAHMVRPPAAFFQNPCAFLTVPPDLLLSGPRSMR